jgi:hypothetical protein
LLRHQDVSLASTEYVEERCVQLHASSHHDAIRHSTVVSRTGRRLERVVLYAVQDAWLAREMENPLAFRKHLKSMFADGHPRSQGMQNAQLRIAMDAVMRGGDRRNLSQATMLRASARGIVVVSMIRTDTD